MVKIAPSLLAADFNNLQDEIIKLDRAGADMLHLDIMDGNFVPNISYGSDIVKGIRKLTKMPFDVHLMVKNPELWVDSFKEAGADIITFHYEATKHHDRLISYIKSQGMKAGLALNPSTNESCLEYLIDKLDLVLVMTVNPGFGGQKFLPNQIQKIYNIKSNYICDKNIMLEVDGGISNNNSKILTQAGADVLVSGSYIFNQENYKLALQTLK